MKKVNFYCGKVNSQGGSKISLLNLIYLIHMENNNFEVFVSKRGWFTEKLDERSINYTIINESTFSERINQETNLLNKLLFLVLGIPKFIRNWIKINKKISNGDQVVINENRDLILLLPALFRRKVEVVLWIRSEYASKLTKILMKRVDKVVVVSDIVKENITGLTSVPIYRIHNFMIDKPNNIIEKSIDNSTVNIAVIGSIQKIKGQLDAVKVLSNLESEKKISLHIIGREFDAIYTSKVKSYVTKMNLGDNVKFIGHVDDVTRYLNENIQLTLIPSQTESFCRVAMESISVGIPVVAYRVGGLKEVILEGETGVLVSKDNVNEMAKSVNKILSNKELYIKMSNNALLDWRTRFYSESIKEQLFEVLHWNEFQT